MQGPWPCLAERYVAAHLAGSEYSYVLAHAKDGAARQWYESWEFEASPTDAFQLYLMVKDLKAAARE